MRGVVDRPDLKFQRFAISLNIADGVNVFYCSLSYLQINISLLVHLVAFMLAWREDLQQCTISALKFDTEHRLYRRPPQCPACLVAFCGRGLLSLC